jgi:DNA-binding response OmpR family regulator
VQVTGNSGRTGSLLASMTPRADVNGTPDAEVIEVGPLEVRPHEFVASLDGHPLELTVRELQLLTELARRAGRIVSRSELYAAVWERPYRSDERSVDVYVRKLRCKLERAMPGWGFIHTHFGFGYRLSPEDPALSPVFHKQATGP